MSGSRPALLDLLTHDLGPYRRQPAEGGVVRFVPDAGGVALEVTERVERRFLGRTTVARFHTTHAGGQERCRLEISHTGSRRRTGLQANVMEGASYADEIAGAISADEGLAGAAHPLDFTSFGLTCADGRWRSTIELMGASVVAIAFPPMRSYVRLYPDQREALTETVAELDRVLRG